MPHELNGLVALDAARADDRLVSLVKVIEYHGGRVLRPLQLVELPVVELMETPAKKENAVECNLKYTEAHKKSWYVRQLSPEVIPPRPTLQNPTSYGKRSPGTSLGTCGVCSLEAVTSAGRR